MTVGGLVDHLFRTEYGKLVAVLTRHFGLSRLDVAEDIVQETLVTAMHTWAYRGVPDRPAAWLMTVARNKALNHLKRRGTTRRVHAELAADPQSAAPAEVQLATDIEDSQLRLMFACCHPEISGPDQLALILRTLGGFGAREAARALLVTPVAIDKRTYRAKQRFRASGISLDLPDGVDLEARLGVVCRALYLLFNEGYSTTAGEDPIRRDLCHEATRLCALLLARFPAVHALSALQALMCLHTARFDSRIDADGALVLFADQDRSRWDRALIARGMGHLLRSAQGDTLAPYHLEASIAAQHCLAPSFDATNWPFIRQLYEALYQLQPNPVVALNLAIVSVWIEGEAAAIRQLEQLAGDPRLSRYPLLYATLAELHRRLGDAAAERSALQTALTLSTSPLEKAELAARLAASAVS